jgi:hypothetical protein
MKTTRTIRFLAVILSHSGVTSRTLLSTRIRRDRRLTALLPLALLVVCVRAALPSPSWRRYEEIVLPHRW